MRGWSTCAGGIKYIIYYEVGGVHVRGVGVPMVGVRGRRGLGYLGEGGWGTWERGGG